MKKGRYELEEEKRAARLEFANQVRDGTVHDHLRSRNSRKPLPDGSVEEGYFWFSSNGFRAMVTKKYKAGQTPTYKIIALVYG